MKRLTYEEIENMTIEGAWDIAQEFAVFIEDETKGEVSLKYEFEDKLPYPKSDILLALLKLLKEENLTIEFQNLSTNDFKIFISTLVMMLNNFIPSEEEYNQMLITKQFLDDKFGRNSQN